MATTPANYDVYIPRYLFLLVAVFTDQLSIFYFGWWGTNRFALVRGPILAQASRLCYTLNYITQFN